MANVKDLVKQLKILNFIFTGNHRKNSATSRSSSSKSTGSTSSKISTLEIQCIVDNLKGQRIRSSTKRNYYSIWKQFNKFFIRLDDKPNEWEDRLVLFVGYLINQNKQSQTIQSYISAIRGILAVNGIAIQEDKFMLSSLTRACRINNDTINLKFPIHKDLLRVLLKALENLLMENNQMYLATLYKALFITTYYGLFRIGEVTSSPHVVLARDVHIAKNKEKMLFILHSSKTHDEGNFLQSIKISGLQIEKQKLKSKFCPFKLLNEYLDH